MDTEFPRGFFCALTYLYHSEDKRLNKKVPAELVRQIRKKEREEDCDQKLKL
jgi:hypothetical protein